jgi:hypothetical protein
MDTAYYVLSTMKTEVMRRRVLSTFPTSEVDQLIREAKRKGLKLATYIRHLVVTHQERAGGAGTR